MATSTTTTGEQTRYEDILAYLPASKTAAYEKNQIIYGLDTSPRSIYMVIKGTVGISHSAEDGTAVLLDIARPDEVFGESAFLDVPCHTEGAEALENALVMSWTVSEMEDLVMKRPRLAVALLQVFAQRNAEYTRRIESFAIDTVARRLARSLLRLSQRLGAQDESGVVSMIPLTHRTLSRYIGTSREIVSQHMNEFRRQGYLTYSRAGISLHGDTLKTVID